MKSFPSLEVCDDEYKLDDCQWVWKVNYLLFTMSSGDSGCLMLVPKRLSSVEQCHGPRHSVNLIYALSHQDTWLL